MKSNKNKNATANATAPAKNKKDTSPKVDVKNLKAATKDVVENKSIYTYPADCNSADLKKAFRRKARAAKKAFETKIKALTESTDKKAPAELKALKAEQTAFIAATYAN